MYAGNADVVLLVIVYPAAYLLDRSLKIDDTDADPENIDTADVARRRRVFIACERNRTSPVCRLLVAASA